MLLLLATVLILDTNTGCKHLTMLAMCTTFALTSKTFPFYVFVLHMLYTLHLDVTTLPQNNSHCSEWLPAKVNMTHRTCPWLNSFILISQLTNCHVQLVLVTCALQSRMTLLLASYSCPSTFMRGMWVVGQAYQAPVKLTQDHGNRKQIDLFYRHLFLKVVFQRKFTTFLWTHCYSDRHSQSPKTSTQHYMSFGVPTNQEIIKLQKCQYPLCSIKHCDTVAIF